MISRRRSVQKIDGQPEAEAWLQKCFKSKSVIPWNPPQSTTGNVFRKKAWKFPHPEIYCNHKVEKWKCSLATQKKSTHKVSASATLTIRGLAPILAVSSWPTDKLEGEDVAMECKILEGYPSPIITWEKDGVPLNTTSNNPVLCLDSVKPENSGDYTCKASNTWGTDTFLIPLRVRRRSRIISTASTYKLVKGESLLINCESEVDKALQKSTNTVWYREDKS